MNPPFPMIHWLAREREEELRKAAAQNWQTAAPRRAPRVPLGTLLLRLLLPLQR
jgi:hypothetical protein